MTYFSTETFKQNLNANPTLNDPGYRDLYNQYGHDKLHAGIAKLAGFEDSEFDPGMPDGNEVAITWGDKTVTIPDWCFMSLVVKALHDDSEKAQWLDEQLIEHQYEVIDHDEELFCYMLHLLWQYEPKKPFTVTVPDPNWNSEPFGDDPEF